MHRSFIRRLLLETLATPFGRLSLGCLFTVTLPMGIIGCGSPKPPTDDMVSIPAGTYTMGNDEGLADQVPAHTVTLGAFEIDRYEVTNAQFERFIRAEDCPGPAIDGNPDPCVYDGAVQSNTRAEYWGNSDFDDYPVVNVRWDQAEAYCRWLGKRLPTEAEWEAAARGSEGLLYPWGEGEPDCSLANFEGCVPDTIAVNGEYQAFEGGISEDYMDVEKGASPFGAVQMAGNVTEWVADYYNDSYYSWGPTDNPQGPANGSSRVVRGGSWYCPSEKVTTTFRDYTNPMLQYNTIGFRCARSLTE